MKSMRTRSRVILFCSDWSRSSVVQRMEPYLISFRITVCSISWCPAGSTTPTELRCADCQVLGRGVSSAWVAWRKEMLPGRDDATCINSGHRWITIYMSGLQQTEEVSFIRSRYQFSGFKPPQFFSFTYTRSFYFLRNLSIGNTFST